MAGSDAANLDELGRLLRRLDKVMQPQSLAEGVRAVESGTERVDAPGHPNSVLRTVVLAGAVSLVATSSMFALLLNDTPVRRFVTALAPAKGDVRSVSPRAVGSPMPAVRPAAVIEATAALPAETGPSSPMQPSSDVVPIKAYRAEASGAAAQGPAIVAAQEQKAPPPAATELSPSPSPIVVSAASPEAKPDPMPPADTSRTVVAELDASQFLRRGLLMLNRGSIGAAQLLLERAADLGSGEAAFTLASTYDGAPGAPGAPQSAPELQPNAGLALRWYARAQELGVEEAGRRLAELNAR